MMSPRQVAQGALFTSFRWMITCRAIICFGGSTGLSTFRASAVTRMGRDPEGGSAERSVVESGPRTSGGHARMIPNASTFPEDALRSRGLK